MLVYPLCDLGEVSTHMSSREACRRLRISEVSVENETNITVAHERLPEKIDAVI